MTIPGNMVWPRQARLTDNSLSEPVEGRFESDAFEIDLRVDPDDRYSICSTISKKSTFDVAPIS